LGVILCAELIAQFFSTQQLTKVTGKIMKIEAVASGSTSDDNWSRGKSSYSLVITLNNGRSCFFDLTSNEWTIQDILQKGNTVTVYYPTVLYDLLSVDILEFGRKGSQLEFNGHVLYNFNQQKRASWPFIGLFAAGMAIACYRLYGVLHGE
jgi:hypothetical protein